MSVREVVLKGECLTAFPDHLYVPHNALRVLLEGFSGPLDLLLYLIRKQRFDILDIPIVKITEQYMQYIELMEKLNIELVSDYLVMAARLAEIKSKALLPAAPTLDEEEEDPRAALMRSLKAYGVIKIAAENLEKLPRTERDYFICRLSPPELPVSEKRQPVVTMEELLGVMYGLLEKLHLNAHHSAPIEQLSVQDKMRSLLSQLRSKTVLPLVHCFCVQEGRAGIVVTFLALLELLREAVIEVVQTDAYCPIYVKAVKR